MFASRIFGQWIICACRPARRALGVVAVTLLIQTAVDARSTEWTWRQTATTRAFGSGTPRPVDLPVSAAFVRGLAAEAGLAATDWRLSRSTRQSGWLILDFEQYLDGYPVLDSYLRVFVQSGRLVAAFAHGASSTEARWPHGPKSKFPVAEWAVTVGGTIEQQEFGWHLEQDGALAPVVEVALVDIEPERKAMIRWDLRDGTCHERRSRIANCDVCGRFEALGTVGFDAVGPSSPVLPLPLPHLTLEIEGTGEIVTTDAQGEWCVAVPSGNPISVVGELSGLYAFVVDGSGPPIEIETGSLSCDSSTNVLVNQSPTDESTAAVNAYVHTNIVHDWFAETPIVPPFTELDFPLQVRVNSPGACNAGFDFTVPEIFFVTEGGACPNSAFTTVVYHEYTHAVVHSIMDGFPNQDLNEGLADVGTTLLTGHPLVGQNFYGPGVPVRDVENDLVFPVVGDIWTRGLVVAGSFFDLRTRLIHELGREDGEALVKLLFVKSLFFMPDAIGDEVVTAVLLADDDDGNLANGTPHDQWIRESFQIHGLQASLMILEPIRLLEHEVSPASVEFSWVVTSSTYDEIIVERDGELLAVLPPDANSFVDDTLTPGAHTYLIYGRTSGIPSPATPRWVLQDFYVRGDADADGLIGFADVFAILQHLFAGAPLSCADAADYDDNGVNGLDDAVALLEYLFTDGPPPTEPFPTVGLDSTVDFLPCAIEL